MPPTSAHLTSIDAVRTLHAALQQFQHDADNALMQLTLESRRPIDWIEHDRTLYWPREVRRASDRLSEARLALQRCELTIDPEDRRSCYDQRKAFERAKRRLELTEAKVAAVKRWKLQIRKAVEEFEVQVEKLKRYLESDLSRGGAALQRMAEALDRYVEQTRGTPVLEGKASTEERGK